MAAVILPIVLRRSALWYILPEVDTVYAEPEKQAEEEKPETTETDEKDKVEDEIQMPEDKSSAGTYLLIGLVAVGAAAGGYYLKVYYGRWFT